MNSPLIQVFCKAPVAGEVKTRLMPKYSAEEAARLHEELATASIRDAMDVAGAKAEIWCAPDTEHSFFAQFDLPRHLQFGDDLGARMSHAMADGLQRSGAVILIGTDCPPIDRVYLEMALDTLAEHDAVIAPAEDGGYGLIGLRRHDPAIFEGITWGGSDVCDETLIRFNLGALDWSALPEVWDVDHPRDVIRYQEEWLERPEYPAPR